MWEHDFVNELKQKPPQERLKVLAKYMKLTGKSKDQLYRIASKNGWESGRKSRSDKGMLKSGLTDEQIEIIVGYIYTTRRENKGPIMPVARALDIAIRNGIVEDGQISVGRLEQIIRDRGLSKDRLKDPEPHTLLRSLHPNHVHQVDVSVCIQYRLKNGKIGIMDEKEFYKNKLHNFAKISRKLLRYVLTDHFSGAFYLKYYEADGETQENLWDFLISAWSNKAIPNFPLHGVPFQMLMDAGSARTAHAMGNFFKGLDIKIPPGRPHNPRRQGSVECMHNIIEKWIETGLRIDPAHTVEELNEKAQDMMVWFNAKRPHSRHKMTRSACWMLIKPNQLRELPPIEDLQDLFSAPEEERTVDDSYRISFNTRSFNLKFIPNIHNRAKVKVIKNIWKWKDETIQVLFEGETYDVKAIPRLPDEMGGFSADAAIIGEEFKQPPKNETQKAIDRINERAYGTREPKKDAVPFAGTKVFGGYADSVGNLAYLPKEGSPIQITRDIVQTRISITEFLKRVKDAVGRVTPELNKDFRKTFGDSIEVARASEVIDALVAGNDWREELRQAL